MRIASSFSISTALSQICALHSVSTVFLFPVSSLILFVISEISDLSPFILLALASIDAVTFAKASLAFPDKLERVLDISLILNFFHIAESFVAISFARMSITAVPVERP